jgi:hypothetical protein
MTTGSWSSASTTLHATATVALPAAAVVVAVHATVRASTARVVPTEAHQDVRTTSKLTNWRQRDMTKTNMRKRRDAFPLDIRQEYGVLTERR